MVVVMVEEDLVAAALAAVVVVLVGSAVGVLAAGVRNEIGKNKKFYALCHIQHDT
jgi:hypothetical protein